MSYLPMCVMVSKVHHSKHGWFPSWWNPTDFGWFFIHPLLMLRSQSPNLWRVKSHRFLLNSWVFLGEFSIFLGFPRSTPYFSGWKVDIFPGRSLTTPLRRLGQGPPGPFRAAGAQDVGAVFGTGGWKRKWLETNMSTSGEIGSFCWFFVWSWLDCEILMVFPSHNFEAPVQSIYWWLSSTHADLASFLFGLYAGLIVGYWWWVFPLTKRACYHWCG